jgi:hypothetical protein
MIESITAEKKHKAPGTQLYTIRETTAGITALPAA